jgi:hypothetical protein
MTIKHGGLVGAHIVSGSVAGTGAALTVSLGFQPKYVKVVNLTSGLQLEWYEDMDDGKAIKTILNGTRTVEAENCITPAATGFIIGTDATNGNGNTLVIQAIG